MISLRHVSKQYKGVTNNKDSGVYLWIKNLVNLTGNKATALLAVNDVSFTVEKSEIFGVYGANGAGKTTLIKLLSGLISPTQGAVEINGQTDARCIKNSVSYISTNGWMGLEWQLTVRENLILYGNMFGLSGKALERRCDEALDAVSMTGAKKKYINELSAGMRQKITIARGLILDRPVVFYDEPSVSLDVQSSRSLRELIRSDAEQNGRTAIIASHNAEDLAICGRIMLLSRGQILAIGTLEELAAPFSRLQIIEVKCLSANSELGLEDELGVVSVACGGADGKRNILSLKIAVRKNEFSFNRLVDFFLERNIPVLGIQEKELTVQDIYEYYLARKEDDSDAVSVP